MRLISLISLTSIAASAGILGWTVVERDPDRLERLTERLAVMKDTLQSPSNTPSRVIYLNREGVTLTSGRDDATQNRTSLVDPGRTAALPAFTGSSRTWASFTKCVEKKLADFDVTVVDQRPVSGDYIMVAVGGRPKDLGVAPGELEHAAGLAPFNGQPIENAVVVVFAPVVGNRSTAMCETAAHEIGHAYGLDHARHCSDLMTYLPRCGARVFLDDNIPCGESSSRACKSTDEATEKQNSYAHMMKVLGSELDPRPREAEGPAPCQC